MLIDNLNQSTKYPPTILGKVAYT